MGRGPWAVRLQTRRGPAGGWQALALLLLAAGLYGMLSEAIGRRERDIAIRVSVGATPARIARETLRPATMISAGGAGLGYLLFAVLSRTLGAPLAAAGMPPGSATVGALLASAMLLIVVFGASLRPVWTAARIAPTTALRCE